MSQYILRNMLLAFFLVQVCTSLGQSEGIVLNESFKNNQHKWGDYNTPFRMAKVWKDNYLLVTRKNKIGLLTDIEIPLDQNSDFSIVANIAKIGGFDGDGYGLCWGKKDKDNSFTFTISGKGVYEIGKWEYGKWQYISRRESRAINKWDAVNKIEINKKGSRILFLINDSLVENQPFEQFFGSRIGFVVYNKMKVKISDFLVKGKSTKPKLSDISNSRRRIPLGDLAEIEIRNLYFAATDGSHELSKSNKGAIHFQLLNPNDELSEESSVWLTCLSKTQRISFPGELPIAPLPGHSGSDFAIPIEANSDFADSEQEIRLQLVDRFGLAAPPQIIKIRLKESLPERVVIEKIVLNDTSQDKYGAFTYGNGNGIPEAGEAVMVRIDFKNTGDKLRKLKVKVYEEKYSPDLALEENGREYSLGDMDRGDIKQIDFNFFSSKKYQSNYIPIGIRFSEQEGGFSQEQSLGLKINEKPKIPIQQTAFSNTKESFISNPEFIVETGLNQPTTFALILGCPVGDRSRRARNDAIRFYTTCRKVLGVPDANIFLDCDNRFHAEDLLALVNENGWLGKKKSLDNFSLIIYFSGSGYANLDQSVVELLNCLNPKFASLRPDKDNLYFLLDRLNASQILIVTDPAFSGNRSSDELGLAENAGVIIPSGEPKFQSNNITYICSGGLLDYGHTYIEKNHNLFSYSFMEMLMTNEELRMKPIREIVDEVNNDILKYKAYGTPLPNVQVYGDKKMLIINK